MLPQLQILSAAHVYFCFAISACVRCVGWKLRFRGAWVGAGSLGGVLARMQIVLLANAVCTKVHQSSLTNSRTDALAGPYCRSGARLSDFFADPRKPFYLAVPGGADGSLGGHLRNVKGRGRTNRQGNQVLESPCFFSFFKNFESPRKGMNFSCSKSPRRHWEIFLLKLSSLYTWQIMTSALRQD